jgi:quinol monooxygenase YgiN
MGELVIATYRPKPGRARELLDLVRGHVPALRELGLATAREPLVLRAADDTLLEIFEWVSREAVQAAHDDPAVRALWARFEQLCDCIPLAELPEAQGPFPHFEVVST